MRPLALTVLLVAVGCGADPDPVAETPSVTDAAPVAAARPLSPSTHPDSIRTTTVEEILGQSVSAVGDTVGVGGLDPAVPLQKMTFSEIPIPFSTYAFEDWTVTVDSSVEGTVVWFSTGEPGPEFVGVQVLMSPERRSETRTRDDYQRWSRGYTFRGGATNAWDLEDLPAWALAGSVSVTPERVGVHRTGEHGGLYFDIVQSFPRVGGARFVAASDTILSRLRWLDDGAGL